MPTQQRNGCPLVALILVNWNGRTITLECLRSLKNVAYPALKVIVVDNGSTDGSVEAIRQEFPGVDVLAMNENLRFAGGNNAGIRRAVELGAEYIALLNNDTIVDAGFLDPLVERCRVNPRCGMAAPKIYFFDQPDVIWFAGGEISMWSASMSHTGIRERDRGQHDHAQEIGYATGCCVLTPAAAVAKVGVLDEGYFMYSEDADWSARMRAAGYEVWYEPASRIWHKVSVSSGGHLSLFKMKHKYSSNFRFFARYARWYHWLVIPWLHPMKNLFVVVRYFAGVAISRTNPTSRGTR